MLSGKWRGSPAGLGTTGEEEGEGREVVGVEVADGPDWDFL